MYRKIPWELVADSLGHTLVTNTLKKKKKIKKYVNLMTVA
jgi:hypothetical protein